MLDTVQGNPLPLKNMGGELPLLCPFERLRAKLAVGEGQLDRGEGEDGESFFAELLKE